MIVLWVKQKSELPNQSISRAELEHNMIDQVVSSIVT